MQNGTVPQSDQIAMTATEKLVQRMLTFDGNFDGYPSMDCTDECLVYDAVSESPSTEGMCRIALMSYLASEFVKTREQYAKARAFINAYVDAAWQCNMSEGSNDVHAEISQS